LFYNTLYLEAQSQDTRWSVHVFFSD
jgi:hypothetical protein